MTRAKFNLIIGCSFVVREHGAWEQIICL